MSHEINTLLKEMVLKTAHAEGITLEPSAADLIALLGDGSFRDTHGMLQKVIHASKDSKIMVEEVEKVTGAPKAQLVNGFIQSIIEKDLDTGLTIIQKANKQNIDMTIFLSMIIAKVRAILLARYSKSIIEDLKDSLTETDYEFVTKYATQANSSLSSATLLALLNAHLMIGKTYAPHIPLEIALFELVQ